MSWQDWTMAAAQVCFVPAMAASIRSEDKPALKTSVMNTVLVAVIAVCQATKGLWAAAATSILVGSTWAVLAIQKASKPRRDPTDRETQAMG